MYLFARHGETESNRLNILRSQTVNEPLNEKGQNQARNLGERLKNEKIDLIEVSPAKRTVETMDIIIGEIVVSSPCPSITYNPDLLEINCGSLDGLKYEEIEQRHPAIFNTWWDISYPDQKHDFPFPDGESFGQILTRAERFVRHLKSATRHWNNILVIGHGTMIPIILCRILGTEPKRFGIFQFENCGLVKIADSNFMGNKQTHFVIF
jgi:broad specificity phosphatase PhoE